MDPQLLVFVLLIAGIALIFAEFFVPSGGMIAVCCVLCFMGSIYAAHRAWGSQPAIFWTYVASLFLIIPGSIYGAFQVLLRSPLADKVFLSAPKSEEVTPHQKEVDRLTRFVGRQGKAQSLMTPGGMILIDGERLHAVAEVMLIQPGTVIEVTGVQGTRVLVRPTSGSPPAPVPPVFEEPSPEQIDPFA